MTTVDHLGLILCALLAGALFGITGTHYLDVKAQQSALTSAVQAQHKQDLAQQAKAEQADQAFKVQDATRIVYRDKIVKQIERVSARLAPCPPIPGEVIDLVNEAGHSQAHIKPPGPFSNGQ